MAKRAALIIVVCTIVLHVGSAKAISVFFASIIYGCVEAMRDTFSRQVTLTMSHMGWNCHTSISVSSLRPHHRCYASPSSTQLASENWCVTIWSVHLPALTWFIYRVDFSKAVNFLAQPSDEWTPFLLPYLPLIWVIKVSLLCCSVQVFRTMPFCQVSFNVKTTKKWIH